MTKATLKNLFIEYSQLFIKYSLLCNTEQDTTPLFQRINELGSDITEAIDNLKITEPPK